MRFTYKENRDIDCWVVSKGIVCYLSCVSFRFRLCSERHNLSKAFSNFDCVSTEHSKSVLVIITSLVLL